MEGGKLKNVTLTINGARQEVAASPDLVLIDYLRDDLHLTGTKHGCDNKGQCGACTVLLNGKAVLSCLRKVTDLEGADIVTVEGLGTPENPHLIQEAYALSGAIQCGYCTPGMIMATKALLDQNSDPDLEEIKKGLARNLCRCTGYVKIIDAVKLAARFLRGETTPAAVKAQLGEKMIGVSHPRPSALVKACGTAEFSADIQLPNAVQIAVVRSTEHHAKLKSVDIAAAQAMPGVVAVLTAEDIKGTNRIRAFAPDEPVLCEDRVRRLGDPIVAVAAETLKQAEAAAAAVKVEYEPLPVMMTLEEALAPGAVQIHPHSPNLCVQQSLARGDTEKAFAEAAAMVEAEFSTQWNHQAPLEPEASVAYMEGEGDDATLVVIGRSIEIHAHKAQLAEALNCENIRYQEAFVGGQFGIKSSITSEAIAAAMALHLRRPARYIPSLEESILMSNKRHAFQMAAKLAADASGHLTAYSLDFVINKGAYFLLGPIPLLRVLYMFNSSYQIDNLAAEGKLVYTNTAPGGAARGAGPPQSNFALESAIDMLADKLGMDQLEFRKINSLRPGGLLSPGTPVKQWPFPELCDAIRPHYERAKKEAAALKDGPIKRGVGLATHGFGIGYPGDTAKVSLEVDPDDGITIYCAIADPGEGNDSMLVQIAGHLLGLPLEKIRLYTRATDRTEGMGPAASSRMTFMGGGALINACEQLQQTIKEAGSSTYAGLQKAGQPTRFNGIKHNPGGHGIDEKTGQGEGLLSIVLNIQMAEVDVDTETGDVRVVKMTSAVDAGTVLHPQNLEGQLEGGMDQGVGYALREDYVQGVSKDWRTFKFPTIRNAFDMELIIRETPRENGALGATGIGEMTMCSTAPAVINAIKDACGVRIFHLPATPEKVKAALAAKAERSKAAPAGG
jgi:aldehyde oxidoreductase